MSNLAEAEITHSRILKISIPIVLSNATVPILGAVDTGVVGQMGEAAPIGAVGIGAVILATVYWIFGFLRMGTTGLVAQARGAGEVSETGALFMRGLLIACAGGAIFIVAQAVLFAGAFWLAPASDEVESLARDYLAIRIWGAPATIALYVVTGWLIAVERTRGVLILQLWMNGLNIALDLWFVLGLGWGVEGVAIATFLAEWSGFALGLWFCGDAFQRPFWKDSRRILDRGRLWYIAAVNRDILIRSLLLETIFVSFLFFGARYGDVPLAANQILLQFLHVMAYALDGFAFSAETLVGTAVGQKNAARVRRASVLTSLWGLGVVVAFSIVIWAVGPTVIDLMTTSDPVRAAAKALLPWMIAAPVLGLASWMFDGIFIGATRTADMRNMAFVSAVIYFIAVWALDGMGNDGLWLALLISLVARGVTLALKYPALERAAGA